MAFSNRLAAAAGEYRILGTDPATTISQFHQLDEIRDRRPGLLRDVFSSKLVIIDQSYTLRDALITHSGTGTFRRLALAFTEPHTFLVASAIYTHAERAGWHSGANPAKFVNLPEMSRAMDAELLPPFMAGVREQYYHSMAGTRRSC